MNLVNYVKVILYTYSRLGDIERDYESHIRLKALTSYDYRQSTEKIAEYIAGQVILKGVFKGLKEKADKVILALTEEEKLLLSLRYFGKLDEIKRRVQRIIRSCGEAERKEKILAVLNLKKAWSERSYFRKQKLLLEKICKRFELIGLTDEVFEEEYGELEFFDAVKRFLSAGKENAFAQKELSFIRELKELTA